MERLTGFWHDFSSQLVSLATLERLGQEFLFGAGPAGILGSLALGSVSTSLLLYAYPMMKSRVARIALMAFSESTAFGMIVLPIYIPWRAVRFIYGLWSFVAFLSLHSRIVEALQSKVEAGGDTPYSGMLRTFFFNLQPRMKRNQPPRAPTLKRVAYYIGVLCLIDLAFFFIWEWIPANVSPARKEFSISVMTGIWVLLLMDLNYQNGIVFLDTMTHSELPHSLRHRHPLLSTSLSQFWGQRWNPVIMRVLQDSFYIPLRRMGSPRAIAVIGCFFGSALLHCIPQFIATDFADALQMASFFVIHGVLVLAEIGFKEVLRGRLVRAVSSNGLVAALVAATAPPISKSSPAPKAAAATGLRSRRAKSRGELAPELGTSISSQKSSPAVGASSSSPWQWAVEMGAAAMALGCMYLVMEAKSAGPLETASLLFVAALTCSGIIFVNRAEIVAAASNDIDSAETDTSDTVKKKYDARLRLHAMWTLAGWLWQLSAIVITLPLFSRPVYNAMKTVYSHSFIVGPLLRALKH